jgi:hypothetical protein
MERDYLVDMSVWIVCKWRTRLSLGNITISVAALYRSSIPKRAKGLYIKVVLLLKAGKGEVVVRGHSPSMS